MKNNFDITRYKELVEKKTRLESQNESLLFENKKEYLEYLSYGSSVIAQISYTRRYEYSNLIKEYLAETIYSSTFRFRILKIKRENGKAEEIITNDLAQLSTFSIDLKSDPFSSIISNIYDNSMVAEEFDPESGDGITETAFRESIKKAFSKM